MTDEEIAILRAIRRNDLKEIIIKFPQGSAKKKLQIVTKKEIQITKEEKESLLNILGKREYLNISIKTNSGGQIYVESIQQSRT